MDYKHIYTDGSKDDIKVGCAVVSDDYSETMRIYSMMSIHSPDATSYDKKISLLQ